MGPKKGGKDQESIQSIKVPQTYKGKIFELEKIYKYLGERQEFLTFKRMTHIQHYILW